MVAPLSLNRLNMAGACSSPRKKCTGTPTASSSTAPQDDGNSIGRGRKGGSRRKGLLVAVSLPCLLFYVSFVTSTLVLFILWQKVAPLDNLLQSSPSTKRRVRGGASSGSRWDTTPPRVVAMEEPVVGGGGLAAANYRSLTEQQHPPAMGDFDMLAGMMGRGRTDHQQQQGRGEPHMRQDRGAMVAQQIIARPPPPVPVVKRTGRAAELEALYSEYYASSTRVEALQSRVKALGNRLTRPAAAAAMLRGGGRGGSSASSSPLVEEIKYLQDQIVAKFKEMQSLEKQIASFKLGGKEADPLYSRLDAATARPQPRPSRRRPPPPPPPRQVSPVARELSPSEAAAGEGGGDKPRPIKDDSVVKGGGGGGGGGEHHVEGGPSSSAATNDSSSSYVSQSALVGPGFFTNLANRQQQQQQEVGSSSGGGGLLLLDLGPGASVVKVRDGECQGDCRLLVTGCGRSGTHFVAGLYQRNGYNVTHERIGTQGSVSWVYGAPATPESMQDELFFSQPHDVYLRHHHHHQEEDPPFSFFPVIHLTRHPIALLSSLATCFCGCGSLKCGKWADTPSWRYAGHHVHYSQELCRIFDRKGTCVDYISQVGRLRRAMEYYIGWNELIEKQAHYRVQLETLNTRELLAVSGLLREDEQVVMVPGDFRSTGKARKAPVTWDVLRAIDQDLANTIAEMALRYGYGRDPTPVHIT